MVSQITNVSDELLVHQAGAIPDSVAQAGLVLVPAAPWRNLLVERSPGAAMCRRAAKGFGGPVATLPTPTDQCQALTNEQLLEVGARLLEEAAAIQRPRSSAG